MSACQATSPLPESRQPRLDLYAFLSWLYRIRPSVQHEPFKKVRPTEPQPCPFDSQPSHYHSIPLHLTSLFLQFDSNITNDWASWVPDPNQVLLLDFLFRSRCEGILVMHPLRPLLYLLRSSAGTRFRCRQTASLSTLCRLAPSHRQ